MERVKSYYLQILSDENNLEEERKIIQEIIDIKNKFIEEEKLELMKYIDDILKDVGEPKNNMTRIITKKEKLMLKKKEIEALTREEVNIQLQNEKNMKKAQLKSIMKETAIEWEKDSHNDRNWELINKNNAKELPIRKRVLEINLELVNRNEEKLSLEKKEYFEKVIEKDNERIKKLEEIMRKKK